MLAGNDPTSQAKALHAYIGETRRSSTMLAMSDPRNQAERERIVSFYATRQPKSVVYMILPCEENADE